GRWAPVGVHRHDVGHRPTAAGRGAAVSAHRRARRCAPTSSGQLPLRRRAAAALDTGNRRENGEL
ncbi:MAG: hypothetical protein AVDCRST_MAG29-2216, partial [uncultured Nocardioidaceae bacterium]